MKNRLNLLILLLLISTPWMALAQTTVTVNTVEATGDEASGAPAVFRLQRTGDSSASLKVRFVLEGIARRFDDYTVDPEPTIEGFGRLGVTIPSGSEFLDVSILPEVDNLAEGDETVTVRLSSGSYDIGDPNEATATIVDDPPVVTITATDSTAGETGPDLGRLQFERSGGNLSEALTVRFEINGDATFNTDYELQPSPTPAGFGRWRLDFPENETLLEVVLTPLSDVAAEDDETATFRLAPDTNFVAGSPDSASVVIADDAPVVTITAPDSTAGENGPDLGRLQFERSGGDLSGPLTVRFEIDGNATFNTDYDLQPSPTPAGFGRWNLTFPENETLLEVVLTPLADVAAEDDETATFRLSPNTSFVAGSPDSASVVIADDSPVVTVTAIDAEASELGPDGATLRFMRSGGDPGIGITAVFDFSGSASSADYSVNPPLSNEGFGRLGIDIPPGVDFVDVDVTPVTDTNESEGEENVTVTLVPRPQYQPGTPATATILIADFVEMVFASGFESGALKSCTVGQAASRNPGRFHDSGVSVTDLETGREWLVCQPDQLFDWFTATCADPGAWAGGVHSDTLDAFNRGYMGDNNGFSDWRYASDRELNGVAARGDCLVRESD